MDYTNEDRIRELVEAQEHIQLAISRIRRATKGTSQEDKANAYIILQLVSWNEGTDPYKATALPGLIQHFESKGGD